MGCTNKSFHLKNELTQTQAPTFVIAIRCNSKIFNPMKNVINGPMPIESPISKKERNEQTTHIKLNSMIRKIIEINFCISIFFLLIG